MSRELELLKIPPEGVLGSMDPDHPSNILYNAAHLPVKDNVTGDVVRVAEKARGKCVLLLAMDATPPDGDVRKEAELRHRVKTAWDRWTAEPDKIPLKKKSEAIPLLFRLLLAYPKIGSQGAEDVDLARRYLTAIIGGDEAVAPFLSIWEAYLPKDDGKTQDRLRQEAKALESVKDDEEVLA